MNQQAHQQPQPGRRVVLAGLALGGLAVTTGPGVGPAGAVAAQPTIRPRSDWATSEAKGPLSNEAAGDVKFLIVHHSETGNDYAADRVARTLNSMFSYHTGDKGWNDIAYNFLVDKYGTIWEGRTGSLSAPVKGDATGGSQGFAQLCCFIGNHTSEPPTQAAQDAMASLLAWLAGRYNINLRAGKTITFTSRGSNKWPAGTQVTTDPIAGHRDMSQTACPGEACYPLVRGALLTSAQAKAGTSAPAASASASPSGSAPASGTAPEAPVPVTSAAPLPDAPTSEATGTAAAPAPRDVPPPESGEVTVSGLNPATVAVVGGGAATAAAVGGAAFLLNRRRQGRALEAELAEQAAQEEPPAPPPPPRNRNDPW